MGKSRVLRAHARRIGPAYARGAALDAAGHACQSCGAAEIPLHLVHIVPLSDLGEDGPENWGVLCPNCHALLDQFDPSERQFVSFVSGLLANHDSFSDVLAEPLFMDGKRALRPDLIVKRGGKTVLVEAKRAAFIRRSDTHSVVAQIGRYRAVAEPDVAAVAFPGRLSQASRSVFEEAGIEIWDIDYIASTFREQIRASDHSAFQLLFSLSGRHRQTWSPAEALLVRLHACPAGRTHWHEFQKIVRDALEMMFCPPLAHPLWESSDASGINRRDIILPNEAENGFWAFMRRRYGADYVVVDPKNYKGRVKKAQVLQIANYLKPHGTGTFAMIFTRNGEQRNSLLTRREQWSVYGKLIVLLDDDDLEAMILAHESGGDAHEVITRTIQEFRLSL